MAFVGKKYKMTASENFDEFMKALGEFYFFYVIYFYAINFTGRCFYGRKHWNTNDMGDTPIK